MKQKKITILIIFLVIAPLKIFSQEEINKEFAVIENKNLVIKERPDLSSNKIDYNKLNPTLNDTFEITGKSDEFYQIKFLSDKNQYTIGWISISDVKKKFENGPFLRFYTEPDKDKMFQRIKEAISHPEWNAIIKSSVYNGEISKGMNRQMVLASIGRPATIRRYFTSNSRIEQWTYQKTPSVDFVLNFENGVITSYRGYKETLSIKFKKELSRRKIHPYRVQGLELMALGGFSFALAFAFLRDSDDKSVLFSKEHKTISWIVLSTVVAAEGLGIYLFLYTKEAKEVSIKTDDKSLQLVYKRYF